MPDRFDRRKLLGVATVATASLLLPDARADAVEGETQFRGLSTTLMSIAAARICKAPERIRFPIVPARSHFARPFKQRARRST